MICWCDQVRSDAGGWWLVGLLTAVPIARAWRPGRGLTVPAIVVALARRTYGCRGGRREQVADESTSPAAAGVVDFFISYTEADRVWAEWIAVELEQAGYTVIVQAFDFRPASDFLRQMEDAVKTARRMLAVVSPAYFASDYCLLEWRAGISKDPQGQHRYLLPVRVTAFTLPDLYTTRVYTDLVGHMETVARRKLLAAAQEHRPHPTGRPYPGPGGRLRRPRYPDAGPDTANLPARHRHFTGRDTILAGLYAQLRAEHRTAIVPTSAIHGLGGIGKTQTALEYAHRYASDYDIVWWINAEQPSTAAAGLAALADELGLTDRADQTRTVTTVLRHLRERDRWLLIYDNAEHPDTLDGLLPTGGRGHVLITSRWADWTDLAASSPLAVMDRTESIQLLRQRCGRTDPAFDDPRWDRLAELLGDLPLALTEAAAYLRTTNEHLTPYLGLVQQRAHDLFGHPNPATGAPPADRDRRRVATTWTLTFDRLHTEAPAGEALLNLLAFLAPDTARQLPTEHSDTLPADLAAVVGDPLAYNQTLAALHQYSIIGLTDDTISVHRLVQTITRTRLTPEQADIYLSAAINLLHAAHPGRGWEYTNWPASERLLPHLLAIADHTRHHQNLTSANLAWLLHQAAAYLGERGQYTTAKPLARQAVTATEQALGPNHRDMTYRRTNLGIVLAALGDHEAARTEYEAAIRIDQATVGPDYPDMAYWRNNLGIALQALGDHDAARTEYEAAIRITETTHGPDHPTMAAYRNNLGLVLQALGDHEAARTELEAAIRITETTHGPDHPHMAAWRNNLGTVLYDLGDHEAARIEYEAAIRIGEATLGPDDPGMAHLRNSLGLVLRRLGDLTGARTEYEAAIRIGEATLPPDHPELTSWRRNLEDLHDAQASDDGPTPASGTLTQPDS